jgi:hypothetical protein
MSLNIELFVGHEVSVRILDASSPPEAVAAFISSQQSLGWKLQGQSLETSGIVCVFIRAEVSDYWHLVIDPGLSGETLVGPISSLAEAEVLSLEYGPRFVRIEKNYVGRNLRFARLAHGVKKVIPVFKTSGPKKSLHVGFIREVVDDDGSGVIGRADDLDDSLGHGPLDQQWSRAVDNRSRLEEEARRRQQIEDSITEILSRLP